MPKFQIAHIHEQGQDIIIVPLNDDFHYKTPEQKDAAVSELQMRSRAANLRGTVCVVWEDPSGRMMFIAPKPWHPFFQGLSMAAVGMILNKELSW